MIPLQLLAPHVISPLTPLIVSVLVVFSLHRYSISFQLRELSDFFFIFNVAITSYGHIKMNKYLLKLNFLLVYRFNYLQNLCQLLIL